MSCRVRSFSGVTLTVTCGGWLRFWRLVAVGEWVEVL